MIKKGNTDVFYEQLKSLNNFLLQEWVEQGNLIENFNNCYAKIVIILDNASFHKIKNILSHIEAEMPNLIRQFLPPYSPDYNLIEFVWHSAKEYIDHRLFDPISQLEELLNKLLNEGGLIIKWERKIQNKVMLFIKFSCYTAYPNLVFLNRFFGIRWKMQFLNHRVLNIDRFII